MLAEQFAQLVIDIEHVLEVAVMLGVAKAQQIAGKQGAGWPHRMPDAVAIERSHKLTLAAEIADRR